MTEESDAELERLSRRKHMDIASRASEIARKYGLPQPPEREVTRLKSESDWANVENKKLLDVRKPKNDISSTKYDSMDVAPKLYPSIDWNVGAHDLTIAQAHERRKVVDALEAQGRALRKNAFDPKIVEEIGRELETLMRGVEEARTELAAIRQEHDAKKQGEPSKTHPPPCLPGEVQIDNLCTEVNDDSNDHPSPIAPEGEQKAKDCNVWGCAARGTPHIHKKKA